ncbi:PAS domain-containing protein [Pelagibius marinus]|uniref:PAS domain-containing protein n=1 Tax=Pelagibius marinus TaxID=2762760 RepID=UPI0018727FBB|nr:PAS domain-containing protein [Pelagibius marinus]
MSRPSVSPTGRERHFDTEEIIVSKTDLQGRITYANDVFLRVAGYTEEEILGQPHNLIRHPDMPHSVFKLLWDTIEAGEEIFAYVINQAKNGDHYWVFAHVTPSFDAEGKISGYHSNRRRPDPEQIAKIEPVYRKLRELESGSDRFKDGMAAAIEFLQQTLKAQGTTYERFVFSL